MSTTTAQTHSASLPSGEVLRISPQQFYFTASRVSPGQVSKVKLKNLSSSPVGYKFKTNAPMKYSVKPVLGFAATTGSVRKIGFFFRASSSQTMKPNVWILVLGNR
ncbi:hypothetical protein BGX24_000342 [Mortierella sp. AD032]|nr:hypothetical protein BGX24_000342 [Mortierella sp. AD032]